MERRIVWGFYPTTQQRQHVERHLEDSYQLFLANQGKMSDKGMVNKYECCGGPVWVLMFEQQGVLQQYVRNDLDDATLKAIGRDVPASYEESRMSLEHFTPIKELYVNDVEVRGNDIVLHIRDSGHIKATHQDGGTTTLQNRGELHLRSTPTGVSNMSMAIAKKDTATLFDMDNGTLDEQPAFPAGVYFLYQGNLIVTPPEALRKLEETNSILGRQLKK